MPKSPKKLADPKHLTLLSKVVAVFLWLRFMQERDQEAGMKDGEEMLRQVYRVVYGKRTTNKSELEKKLKPELRALRNTHDIKVDAKDPGALRLLLSIENWFFGRNFGENMKMLSTQENPTFAGLVTLFKTIFEKYTKEPNNPAFKIIGANYPFEKSKPNNDYRNLWLELLKTQQQTLEKFNLSVQGGAAQGQGAPVDVFSPENAYVRPESPVPNWPGAVTQEVVIVCTVQEPVETRDDEAMQLWWVMPLPPAEIEA